MAALLYIKNYQFLRQCIREPHFVWLTATRPMTFAYKAQRMPVSVKLVFLPCACSFFSCRVGYYFHVSSSVAEIMSKRFYDVPSLC